jgi:methionine-rich copper-binding protein CopC
VFLMRALLAGWGLILLVFGLAHLAAPRARLVTAMPAPGTTLGAPPSEVVLRFSEAMGGDTRLTVGPTFTVPDSGGPVYGSDRDTTVHGPEPADTTRRTLRVAFGRPLERGLYAVQWRTEAARGRAARHGTAYFAVGIPVPDHILRDHPKGWYERDVRERQHRSTLAGGAILLVLAFLVRRRG